MRKNLIVTVLLLGLVAALSAPATAAKKKKLKPYKSETVTIAAGHPAFYTTAGTPLTVTAQEFLQTCSIPKSNGVDAWVFAVPKAYQKVAGTVQATGKTDNSTVGYDLDLFTYDKKCKNNGVYNSAGTDESGVLSKGTAFVLVHAYAGNPVDAYITIKQ